MTHHGIDIPKDGIVRFCKRHHIRKLALFGSILRDDFGDHSDIDVLVEFEPGCPVGLIRLAGIEEDLSQMLGRHVDLNTPGFLSPYFREQVLEEAEVQYDAA
jgi:hypothetical protein